MHLANAGAAVNGTVIVAGSAMHNHTDLCHVADGDRGRADGIHGSIAAGPVRAPLRADDDHGHRGLQHEGERCCGVHHGIGAMGYDDTFRTALNLLRHSPRETGPVFGTHVLAQNLIDHPGMVVGNLLQLRDGGDDLACRELAGDGTGPVIDLTGNGSPSG